MEPVLLEMKLPAGSPPASGLPRETPFLGNCEEDWPTFASRDGTKTGETKSLGHH